jgi:hypothetical protein
MSDGGKDANTCCECPGVCVDPISFHRAFIHALDYSSGMGVTMTEVYEFECCMGLLCNSRHIWYRSTLRSVNSIVELTYRCRPFLILGSIELNLVKYNRK